MLRRVMMSMGNTYFRSGNLRMARMAGKAEEPQRGEKLSLEPEYKDYESVGEIQKGEQNPQTKPWLIKDHLSASDEINQRGLEQRAKEWGVPIEKLDQLRPWEHDPAKSTGTYKQTVLQGTPPSSIHERSSEGFTMASGAKQSTTTEKASEIKDTNQDTTRAQVDKTTKDQGLTADDEIKHRGIEQRAKEWGVPIEKLEELKPWEHQPSESHLDAYKKTVLAGKEEKFNMGNRGMTQKSKKEFGTKKDPFKSAIEYNELASGRSHWEPKFDENGKVNGASKEEVGFKDQRKEVAGEEAQVKNAQNSSDLFDQSMVDRAMSWVKDKFGGSGTSTGKEGPTADHNALNKGYENHRDSVHDATFTKYEDSKKPFSSSVEEGQKKTAKKDKVKDYLTGQQ